MRADMSEKGLQILDGSGFGDGLSFILLFNM